MSERRCFSKIIIDSDLFLDMPLSSQLLYFHLGMWADDEGFVNNPHKIQRSVGCSDDDLKTLEEKGFVIPFDSGVIVITHWNIHNTLRKDRTKATICQREKALLFLDEKGAYTLDGQMSVNCQPNDNQVTTKCPPKISKDKISKDKLRESKAAEAAALPPSKPADNKKAYGEFNNVMLSNQDMAKLKADYPDSCDDYIERLSSYIERTGKKYKSHYATIKNWIKQDDEKKQTQDSASKPDYSTSILEVI